MTVEHREVLELLPWYANGTLTGDERITVERHLSDCLPCNAALKEERRLLTLVQSQEASPIGPDSGIAELLRRVERGDQQRGFKIGIPEISYGLAAAFGGAIVWAFFSLNQSVIDNNAEFSTLSTVSESATNRIDVVFVSQPGEREIAALLNDLNAVLISGPSELGRYTFALGPRTESALNEIIANLQANPAIRFAGRSFMESSDEAGGNQ